MWKPVLFVPDVKLAESKRVGKHCFGLPDGGDLVRDRAIELKVWREGRRDPLPAGLAQIDSYLAGLNLDWGWLVIFDRREGLPDICDRTTTELAETDNRRKTTVIRG